MVVLKDGDFVTPVVITRTPPAELGEQQRKILGARAFTAPVDRAHIPAFPLDADALTALSDGRVCHPRLPAQ